MEGVGRRLGDDKSGFLVDIGHHSLNGREHNVLFRNDGNEKFTEVGWVTGADRIEDARGLAIFDRDGDGRLDLLIRNYRTEPGLLLNEGPERSWVMFELEGTRSNRDAVGARIRLLAGDHWQTRVVSTGSSYLSSSSLRQHFGLGDADRIDRIEIDWPSGERTILQDIEPNRAYRIKEGDQLAAGAHPPQL